MPVVAGAHVHRQGRVEVVGGDHLLADELLLEAPENEVAAVKNLVREEMIAAYELDPPLAVDVGAGDDWNEAKS